VRERCVFEDSTAAYLKRSWSGLRGRCVVEDLPAPYLKRSGDSEVRLGSRQAPAKTH
jgi:hypothetical protein